MRARPSPVRFLAPLAVMGTIFYFSAQPFNGHDLEWYEVLARKLGHVTGYFMLTSAWIWALAGRVRRPLVLAAAIAFAWSCSDEWHQTFVDGRSGSPRDVAIDSVGIALACGAATLAARAGRGGGARSSPAPSP